VDADERDRLLETPYTQRSQSGSMVEMNGVAGERNWDYVAADEDSRMLASAPRECQEATHTKCLLNFVEPLVSVSLKSLAFLQ
jgi:hypothetical protein